LPSPTCAYGISLDESFQQLGAARHEAMSASLTAGSERIGVR
jgi:hypothetical protein